MVFMACFFVVNLLFTFILAGWTDSNLEFWLSYIAGHPVDVPYWISFLLTLVTSIFGVAGNLIMEVAKLAL